MTREHANELIEFGRRIQVKVSPEIIDHDLYVNIRDCQTKDFIEASLMLQNIQRSELPESRVYLFG